MCRKGFTMLRHKLLLMLVLLIGTGIPALAQYHITMPKPTHPNTWRRVDHEPRPQTWRSTRSKQNVPGFLQYMILAFPLGFIPLLVARMRNLPNWKSYIWKCGLFGWLPVGFVILLAFACIRPRGQRVEPWQVPIQV